MKHYIYTILFFFLLCPLLSHSQNSLLDKADAMAIETEQQVIDWRRHFHEFPKLSNREFNTGKKMQKYSME